MSLEYKILGQELISYSESQEPGGGGYGYYGYGYYGSSIGGYGEAFSPLTIYTVPAEKQTTVTAVYVANHSNTEITYDFAVVPSGEELSLKHHLRWDMPIAANDFEVINTKITMSAGDKLVIFPSTVGIVSVTAFGVEK